MLTARPSGPDLHQAFQAPRQAETLTQPMPYVKSSVIESEASSSSSVAEPTPSQVTHQFEQLSVQKEGSSSEIVQHTPASSKHYFTFLEHLLSLSQREREFKVVIKLASRADLHHLDMFLRGRQTDSPQEALQVLDIVLREMPTSRFSPVGRSFYAPDIGTRQPLGEGLESWRGFYQSIRPTQMGLSLNIDMSSTAFIEPLHVNNFISELLSRDVSSRPLSDADRVKGILVVSSAKYILCYTVESKQGTCAKKHSNFTAITIL